MQAMNSRVNVSRKAAVVAPSSSFAAKQLGAVSSSFVAPNTVAPMVEAKSVSARATRVNASRAQTIMASGNIPPQKVLIMGGTRFIGVYLARLLVERGHEVHLLTRGKKPVTFPLPDESDADYRAFASKVKHVKADRKDYAGLKQTLRGYRFDVVFDINAREAEEVQGVLDACPGLKQYIFCSSAGVYLKSEQMPHREEDAVDFKSRHKGKLESEELLRRSGVNWTSIRPVYIYGPLNYNPVEEYFFHRIAAGRPVCVPGAGNQITQLGHVEDLAEAFYLTMANPVAYNKIYNISGQKYVTFAGLAKACAKAAGKPEPEIVSYNPKEYDFGKKKAFPFRDQHFFASVDKAMEELGWFPKYDLYDGLRSSWEKDYKRGRYCEAADFETDDIILASKGKKAAAGAAAPAEKKPWTYSW